jgi:hypothetical protein
MKHQKVLLLLIIASVFTWSTTAYSQSESTDPQKIIAQLKAENEALKQEIQNLRKLLATGSTTTSEATTEPKTATPTVSSTSETANSTGFWLTSSSKKRHNSSCRYYKNSKGSECGQNDGIPCKSCGG